MPRSAAPSLSPDRVADFARFWAAWPALDHPRSPSPTRATLHHEGRPLIGCEIARERDGHRFRLWWVDDDRPIADGTATATDHGEGGSAEAALRMAARAAARALTRTTHARLALERAAIVRRRAGEPLDEPSPTRSER